MAGVLNVTVLIGEGSPSQDGNLFIHKLPSRSKLDPGLYSSGPVSDVLKII